MNERELDINRYMMQAHRPQVNSILVWENEKLSAELYYNGFDRESRHPIKSVVKSILSLAAGIATDEGLLDLEDPIYKYIPEFAEGRDMQHKRIKIEHLLSMTSGIFWQGGVHYHCPMMDAMRRSQRWIDYIADCEVKNIPGTFHNYKEWDVILLAAVLDKVCGDCYDYIREKIYEPLEITSERWYRSPDGVYYSVADGEDTEKLSNLCGRDLMKIGVMLLNNGVYHGKTIVSEKYLKRATTPGKCDPQYGFLFWINPDGFSMSGYGGQHVYVIPDQQRVIVTQATPTSRPMAYFDLLAFLSDREPVRQGR